MQTIRVLGMTCESCEKKVGAAFSKISGVQKVHVDRKNAEAHVSADRKIPATEFQSALKDEPKYQVFEVSTPMSAMHVSPLTSEPEKGMLQTFLPLILIFSFIFGVTTLTHLRSGAFSWMSWMNHFMAGFFLVFSFFKFINLPGFVEGFATYDPIAKKIRGYGWVYPFIELGLGVCYLLEFTPLWVHALTIVALGITTVGVIEVLAKNNKIQCACLGTALNLPMTKVTVFENTLMIAMAATAIAML